MTTAFPSRLPVSASSFSRDLLRWYEENRRSLPWRNDSDPYKIWIAETMLQQTTVQAVLPYYRAFLETFPHIECLAGATESAVLARWAGLGYYDRARNLLKTARLICQNHDGRFPRDFQSALALPGIGLYTAGAILSIAYGLPFPVVDGNVGRVFSRYLGFDQIWDQAAARALRQLLAALIEREPARSRTADFNQGLMELGALVCTPRRPACRQCPLATGCAACGSGNQESIPRKRAARRSIATHYCVALVSRGQSLLMRPNQAQPFPKDLWEPPRVAGKPSERLLEEFESSCGLRLHDFRIIGVVSHSITHYRLRIHVLAAQARSGPVREGFAWVDPAGSDIAVSSYLGKALCLLGRCDGRMDRMGRMEGD
jgi:A/G-specific adenine glycosylase